MIFLTFESNMKPFIVSALKYRPQEFKDVVGQSAITETLQNAIKKNQLSQALLFCGPRGVGKTTCARILAKKINSLDKEIGKSQDFAFNIFELDAASNNSVEDIRSLNDKVRIPPQVGTHTVYIIDEVHMLSVQAFNAFLKTLEEPPKHVIFILATTEKHKIIPTILSRCQIFEFKRITVSDTQNFLVEIAQKQGVAYEDEALHLIAQKADGAMRDALSIFDRVSSFCNQNLTTEAVAENLNILDKSTYLKFTDYLIAHDIPSSLIEFDNIQQKGIEGDRFISGLATHFRDLLICKNPKTIPLLEISESIHESYKDQVEKTSLAYLIDAIDLANSSELNYKASNNKRVHIELCIMQLASLHFGEKKKRGELIPSNNLPIATPSKIAQKPSNSNNYDASKKGVLEEDTPKKETIADEKSKVEIESVHSNQVSSMSLSSIQKKKNWKEKQNSINKIEKELPNEDFTLEELIHFWDKYRKHKFDNGGHNIASLLKISTPILVDNKTIHFNVISSSNKVELEKEFIEFTPYLRESLKNHSFVINIIINEQIEKKLIYTPEEKYNHMRKINPAIDLLREKLDLSL